MVHLTIQQKRKGKKQQIGIHGLTISLTKNLFFWATYRGVLIHGNLFTTDGFSIQQAVFRLAVLFQTATIALNIEIGIFFRKTVTYIIKEQVCRAL